jgi:hypothetical protein
LRSEGIFDIVQKICNKSRQTGAFLIAFKRFGTRADGVADD